MYFSPHFTWWSRIWSLPSIRQLSFIGFQDITFPNFPTLWQLLYWLLFILLPSNSWNDPGLSSCPLRKWLVFLIFFFFYFSNPLYLLFPLGSYLRHIPCFFIVTTEVLMKSLIPRYWKSQSDLTENITHFCCFCFMLNVFSFFIFLFIEV